MVQRPRQSARADDVQGRRLGALRKVYAHYFLNGKRLKTVEIGSVSGPCGDLTKKLRQFPFRPVPAGRYPIRFSGTPFFDPQGFWIGYRDVVVPKAKAVR